MRCFNEAPAYYEGLLQLSRFLLSHLTGFNEAPAYYEGLLRQNRGNNSDIIASMRPPHITRDYAERSHRFSTIPSRFNEAPAYYEGLLSWDQILQLIFIELQ